MKRYAELEYSFYPLPQIKHYNITRCEVNLDCGNEVICYVHLDINDEEYVNIAKKITDDDGFYYDDGWFVEVNVDENGQIVDQVVHTLFYVDEGRVGIGTIEDKEGTNNKLIKDVDCAIVEFIRDYLKNPEERKKYM